jgi:CubicO group peptidase (beta-lactamase class C family)
MGSTAHIDESGNLTLGGTDKPVPWWSFTKTVLAIAALRLVEQGFALDERVEGERYSLAQLLRHESGLPDYGVLSGYHRDVAAGVPPWPAARLLAEAKADQPWFRPGADWAYSNIGYMRVAALIEAASGSSLSGALERLVFAPAALATARLALTPSDLANVAMGDAADYHPGWVYHGLVTGTISDAARLLQALAKGQLLQPETFTRMVMGRPLPEHPSPLHPDPAYGLGLMLPDHRAVPLVFGHEGAGPGSTIAVYARGGTISAAWAPVSSSIDPAASVLLALTKPED